MYCIYCIIRCEPELERDRRTSTTVSGNVYYIKVIMF